MLTIRWKDGERDYLVQMTPVLGMPVNALFIERWDTEKKERLLTHVCFEDDEVWKSSRDVQLPQPEEWERMDIKDRESKGD